MLVRGVDRDRPVAGRGQNNFPEGDGPEVLAIPHEIGQRPQRRRFVGGIGAGCGGRERGEGDGRTNGPAERQKWEPDFRGGILSAFGRFRARHSGGLTRRGTVQSWRVQNREQSPGWNLGCTYAGLPGDFYSRVDPSPVAKPELAIFNRGLARNLGLDADGLACRADIFAGNTIPEGAFPIAQAYAGHQYGHFTNLGDGRAILLGEQADPRGARFDVQLKGAGPTPYSRRGDGRAALGPMLREYLVSEAMFALGIPTTRSLAVALTGEAVFREEMLPGAVLTRIAASHIRVGTFEWAAASGLEGAPSALADYCLARHFPHLAEMPDRHLAMFGEIVSLQASLVARWQLVGFVHGVMNTDNMAVSGETIDYGPCAFLDAYDPAVSFSSIDRHGRYAYGQQPTIAHWNLARLGEAMMHLFDSDSGRALDLANGVLSRFPSLFEDRKSVV